jgi:hypothetical protein
LAPFMTLPPFSIIRSFDVGRIIIEIGHGAIGIRSGWHVISPYPS